MWLGVFSVKCDWFERNNHQDRYYGIIKNAEVLDIGNEQCCFLAIELTEQYDELDTIFYFVVNVKVKYHGSVLCL